MQRGRGLALGYHSKGYLPQRAAIMPTGPFSARTMPRPDEREHRSPRGGTGAGDSPTAGVVPDGLPPSKTRRKAEMHALRDLGEALVALDPRRFAELAAEAELPDRLVDAIREARSITAWGGRKRQLQYVGKLMRDVDPQPIRRCLDLWAHGQAIDAARQHALERWRERLIAEPAALDLLAARKPRLDRPRLRALIAQARDERARGRPPHAFRELFRELKALDREPDAVADPTLGS
jgi:ribosome-associated protein